jgi:hypothetical protein
MLNLNALAPDAEEAKRTALIVVVLIIAIVLLSNMMPGKEGAGAPKFGEYILFKFTSKDNRESLIGDLAEEYLEILSNSGRRVADFWYYKQVLHSIWPLAKNAVRRGVISLVQRHM